MLLFTVSLGLHASWISELRQTRLIDLTETDRRLEALQENRAKHYAIENQKKMYELNDSVLTGICSCDFRSGSGNTRPCIEYIYDRNIADALIRKCGELAVSVTHENIDDFNRLGTITAVDGLGKIIRRERVNLYLKKNPVNADLREFYEFKITKDRKFIEKNSILNNPINCIGLWFGCSVAMLLLMEYK